MTTARREAAVAAAKLGYGRVLHDELRESLNDPSPGVREAAVRALAAGRPANEAIALMRELETHPDAKIRAMAAMVSRRLAD